MKKCKITEARKVCEEHEARQAIVIVFDGDRVSGASYGTTKAECRAVGQTLDAIVDGLMRGAIPAPEVRPPVLAEYTNTVRER
jgi:hypothetical protein